MELLDLPPEVFQQIVAIYVSTVGIRKAAKARETSKTFLCYINEEMFARQPTNKFTTRVPKKLLTKNMALFLEYRSQALYGAPDILPSMIQKTTMKFMEITGETSSDVGSKWIKRVTKQVVQHCGVVMYLAITPTAKRRKDFFNNSCKNSEDCDALMLAISLDDLNLVSAMLRRGINLWMKSPTLGYPLHLAARIGNLDVLSALLSSGVTDKSELSSLHCSNRIGEAIFAAKHDTESRIAIALLNFYTLHVGRPSLSWCSRMIYHAVSGNEPKFLDVILSLEVPRSWKEKYRENVMFGFRRCKSPEPILHVCIDRDLISLYGEYRCYESDARQTLAELAVKYHNTEMVNVLLKFNKSSYFWDAPLRLAVERNCADIVQILLHHGIDPEGPGWKLHRQSLCEVAKSRSEVYFMVKKALEKKIRRLGEDYEAPLYLIWDPKKQADVRVAYSFHAPKL
ncbi:hypothetical protein P153DRAFT_359978 [Dothidotthia symphoricarpi CBS 119687]|uniref:Uncharacterized protein n=1 Tax=Dothidotthia symphoricarpi CBS 119687 TaxID=1392245 RepID=A0A6A6A1A7_9PLEO|nr:uncharacterized protein P153DRAFT_359978 [Dothidotthia symphoricarpi CBS 119687]KAF2125629.1 hypothetical protein P153DRAFT_359978 [Dothidotthia symphoricarpi CBS 119687]